MADFRQIAVELHHGLALQVVPRHLVEVFGGADIDAVFRLEGLDDGLTVAVEILDMRIGHVPTMRTGATVDAIGAEGEQFLGLNHSEGTCLGPGIIHQTLEVRLAVFADPLAVRVLVEELRMKAGEAVVEDVDGRKHFHSLLMPCPDERFRRIEVADVLRRSACPYRSLDDVSFDIGNEGRHGIRPGVLRVETHRIRQLGAIGQDTQASAADDQRLAAVLLKLRDQSSLRRPRSSCACEAKLRR